MPTGISKILPFRLRRAVKAFLQPERIVFLKDRITYSQDGLISIMNTDFLGNADFVDAYAKGAATGSWGTVPQNKWRIFVVCWASRHCAGLGGDFVECGVYRGGLARAVIEYTDFNSLGKKFFLFDTYEGLVDKQITETEKLNKLDSQYAHYKEQDVFDFVANEFAGDNVSVIKGEIPDSLDTVDIEKVAFLSIDMNSMVPEIAAINHFWPKLLPGALVVLDDYEWPQHEEQRNAFNAFAAENNTQVLPLPTGQGLIVKQDFD